MLWCISSLAVTPPPGELTSNTTATTLVSCPAWLFVFQAEDGIRDWSVTGVQTCALPICPLRVDERQAQEVDARAEDCEQRGEDGQPVEHREGDHDRAGEAYGVQVGHVEEQEPHKAYGDREAGEQDRASR